MISMSALRPIILAAVLASQPSAVKPPTYDGQWWRRTSREQHLGWLVGYIACAVEHGDSRLAGISWYALEPEITAYYEAHGDQSPQDLVLVLTTLASGAKTRMGGPGDATSAGQSAGLDGEYWRQLPGQRLGVVQGFLACYQKFGIKEATFSRPASYYAGQISEYYGVRDDDPAAINPRRAETPIEDVLLRLRDTRPGASARGVRHGP